MLYLDESFRTSMDLSIDKSLRTLSKTKSEREFHCLETKIKNYLDVYDGSLKSFLDMMEPFDDLFHENYLHWSTDENDDGKEKIMMDREGLKDAVKSFLSAGMKADLIELTKLEGNRFEEKIRFRCSKKVDVICHAIGTVLDGKVVKMEPCEDSIGSYAKLREVMECQRKAFQVSGSERSLAGSLPPM